VSTKGKLDSNVVAALVGAQLLLILNFSETAHQRQLLCAFTRHRSPLTSCEMRRDKGLK
jgi:hypothetical protein